MAFNILVLALSATLVLGDNLPGSQLFGQDGTLTSPGFPNSQYPNNFNNNWTITVEAGYAINIESDDSFDVETHSDCIYDFVKVYDGISGELLVTRCGRDGEITSGTSLSSVVVVVFHTDGSVTGGGWSLNWSAVRSGSRELSGQDGTIASPGFPTSYTNNVDFNWTITVEPGYAVSVVFEDDFDVESQSECNYDYVKVYDGITGSQLLIKCDREGEPLVVTSATNVMIIVFHTDPSVTRSGWRMIWTADSVQHCPSNLVGESGSFSSPNYPENYGNSIDCNTTITVTSGVIGLDFTDFDTESTYDYVKVYGENDELIRTLTGSGPFTITLTVNSVRLYFHTDTNVIARGWNLNWFNIVDGNGNV